jgi:hypothetical protein
MGEDRREHDLGSICPMISHINPPSSTQGHISRKYHSAPFALIVGNAPLPPPSVNVYYLLLLLLLLLLYIYIYIKYIFIYIYIYYT